MRERCLRLPRPSRREWRSKMSRTGWEEEEEERKEDETKKSRRRRRRPTLATQSPACFGCCCCCCFAATPNRVAIQMCWALVDRARSPVAESTRGARCREPREASQRPNLSRAKPLAASCLSVGRRKKLSSSSSLSQPLQRHSRKVDRVSKAPQPSAGMLCLHEKRL